MKKLKNTLILISLILLAAFNLAASNKVQARPNKCQGSRTCPYFKIYGGDVFSGGWYIENGTCSLGSGSHYQDPNFSPKNPLRGGILSYAGITPQHKPDGGASDEYAAIVLGNIEGDTKNHGFYSGGSLTGAQKVNYLSFAHDDGLLPSSWGGTFQGNVPQTHCIPNYYQKLPADAQNWTGFGAQGVFKATGNVLHLNDGDGSGSIITRGQNITLYVDGSVYIRNDIKYDLATISDVPKFALVVKGSIYIDPRVHQLDGLYIAQPDPSDRDPVANDTGDIWTCHGSDISLPTNDYLVANCLDGRDRLVINGALIAKQVNFMRLQGDVGDADPAEDAACANAVKRGTPDASCANIAEIINYSPAMVLGGRFFTPPARTQKLNVQSLISLPPAL